MWLFSSNRRNPAKAEGADMSVGPLRQNGGLEAIKELSKAQRELVF